MAFIGIQPGTAVVELVGDTTPQLGGNLDVNGQDIVSVSNGNITITAPITANSIFPIPISVTVKAKKFIIIFVELIFIYK